MSKKRAAIYVRVSSRRQAGPDKVSPKIQERDCRELAEEQGYEVVEVIPDTEKYKSKGKMVEPSGRRKDRPGFNRLLEMATSGEIDVIIAWKEDRLYRSMWPAAMLDEVLDEKPNLRVELARETFDQKMLGIKAGMAKAEAEDIRLRNVEGRKEKLRMGHLPGGALPLGYERDEANKAAVNEVEAEAVRLIFEMYADGETANEIARQLTLKGYATRQDKKFLKKKRKWAESKRWTQNTVQGIVQRSTLYATGQYVTELDGEQYTLKFPTIIDEGLWQRVERQREYHKQYRGGPKFTEHYHVLRGLVTCNCGWSWLCRYDKRWPANARYYCPVKGRGHERAAGCGISYRIKDLDEAVWRTILDYVLNPERLQEIIDQAQSELQGQVGELDAEIKRLEADLEQMENERQWVLSMARKKQMNEKDLNHQLSEVSLQTGAIEKDLEGVRIDRALALGEISEAEGVVKRLAGERSIYSLLTTDFSDVKANSKGELPEHLPVVLVGNIEPDEDGYLLVSGERAFTEDGEPVMADEYDLKKWGWALLGSVQMASKQICQQLGAAAFVADTDGDWAVALRRAQREAKRSIIKRFVRRVIVSQDEAGDKDVQLELAVPVTVDLNSPARTIKSNDWCRK